MQRWLNFWNPKKDATIQAKKIWNPSKEGFWNRRKEDFEIQSKKTFEIQKRLLKSNEYFRNTKKGAKIQAKKYLPTYLPIFRTCY